MALNNDEKEFVEEFNKKSYQPELLFGDPGIIERIKDHPMAIWKTLKRLWYVRIKLPLQVMIFGNDFVSTPNNLDGFNESI